ncbi:hypothetical protein [Streptomyces arboris]|nr:hypothetical protein [Streptomyces arboris]
MWSTGYGSGARYVPASASTASVIAVNAVRQLAAGGPSGAAG